MKARRVKAGQTAAGGSLGRGGEPDSPALPVGITELSVLRKAGFPVLDAEPRLAAWWPQTSATGWALRAQNS